jgi:hypothetical protein
MRIELETLEPRYRPQRALECYFCGSKFAAHVVTADAFTDNEGLPIFCGHVCPGCIERGEEWLERRLESNAAWARAEAEEKEVLRLEGVSESPTVEEYRLFERIAALD